MIFLRILLTCGLMLIVFGVKGQKQEPVDIDTLTHHRFYKSVEVQPEPDGGVAHLYALILKKVKLPAHSRDSIDISQTRIIVAFIVMGDGKIEGGRIVNKPTTWNRFLGLQILEIIQNYKWKPAMLFGKPVNCMYTLPLQLEYLGNDD